MRYAGPLVCGLILGTLACGACDAERDASQIAPARHSSISAAHTDPWVGKWITREKKPLQTLLLLKADGTFSIGDVSDGQEFPDALTGTWTKENEDVLCLKVQKSENCRISPDCELAISLTLRDDGRVMVARNARSELVFVRADDVDGGR